MGRRFCREAPALQRQLFRLWHRFRGDPRTRGAPLTRTRLIAKVLPIDKRFFVLAERHVNASDADVSNLARAVLVHQAVIFDFPAPEGPFIHPKAAQRTELLFVTASSRFRAVSSARGDVRSTGPLFSRRFSDTAPHLGHLSANRTASPLPRVSLPAPAASRSSATCRRTAAGLDALPPAGASSTWHAAPAGARECERQAFDPRRQNGLPPEVAQVVC